MGLGFTRSKVLSSSSVTESAALIRTITSLVATSLLGDLFCSLNQPCAFWTPAVMGVFDVLGTQSRQINSFFRFQL